MKVTADILVRRVPDEKQHHNFKLLKNTVNLENSTP